MTARIYTGAEARALREDFELNGRGDLTEREPDWNWICSSAESCILFVASPDLAASVEHHAARADAAEERAAVAEAAVHYVAACAIGNEAHGLSWAALAIRMREMRGDVRRVTMERDGARLSLDAAQSARIAQSLELADARAEVVRLTARVAELESLATGPRSLTIDAAACDAIDGGATAGPQHVDATGREVLL